MMWDEYWEDAADHIVGDGRRGDRRLMAFTHGDHTSPYGSDPFRRELGERGEDAGLDWIDNVLDILNLKDVLFPIVQWETTLGQSYLSRVDLNKRNGDILLVDRQVNQVALRVEVKATTDEYPTSATFPGTDELEISEADLLLAFSFTRGFILKTRWAMRMTNVKDQAHWTGKFWIVNSNGPLDLEVILPRLLKSYL